MISAQIYLAYQSFRERLNSFLKDERGDTNFISIVIVLGIVVAIAVFFSSGANELVKTMWQKITTNTSGLGNTG